MSKCHFVCADLSIAFGAYQSNATIEALSSAGHHWRGRQRWPAKAICKIQPYGSTVFQEGRWANRHNCGQFCINNKKSTKQIHKQADNFGHNINRTMTSQSYTDSVGIFPTVRWFKRDQGGLDWVSEYGVTKRGQVHPISEHFWFWSDVWVFYISPIQFGEDKFW